MKEQDSMQVKIRLSIDKHLRIIGAATNSSDFEYLKEAIAISVENPDLLINNSKVIYYDVAKCFDTTYQNVEKGIRKAIKRVFDSSENSDSIYEYFGNTIKQDRSMPTDLEFITAIKEYVSEEFSSSSVKIAARYLRVIGVPMRLKGYQYLKIGIALGLDDYTLIQMGCRVLYGKLEEVFYQKKNLIRQDMYEAIKKTYNEDRNLELLHSYFGNFRPTGFYFVKCVVNQIIKDEDIA